MPIPMPTEAPGSPHTRRLLPTRSTCRPSRPPITLAMHKCHTFKHAAGPKTTYQPKQNTHSCLRLQM